MSGTPTIDEVIKTGVDAALKEVHTAMPGVVVSYDKLTGFATVQPALQRTYVGGVIINLPRVVNVPVWQPRAKGGLAFVHLPVAANDPCLLIFSERSIDRWKTKGGIVDPQDFRRHSLTDAYALPGGYPKSIPLPADVDGDKITIGYGTTRFTLSATGQFGMANAGGEFINKLLGVLDDFVANTKVATIAGLQPLIPGPAYLNLRAELEAFKEAL